MMGQAIAEVALVLPLLLFMALGFVEAGLLINAKGDQDRATSVVASWAALHPGASWQPVAARLLPDCTVSVAGESPDLVTATATCHYHPKATHGLWDGLAISSSESAAAEPSPSGVTP